MLNCTQRDSTVDSTVEQMELSDDQMIIQKRGEGDSMSIHTHAFLTAELSQAVLLCTATSRIALAFRRQQPIQHKIYRTKTGHTALNQRDANNGWKQIPMRTHIVSQRDSNCDQQSHYAIV